MSFRKIQSVEKVEVLPQADHARIEKELHQMGKTSAKGLSDSQREKLSQALESATE